MDRIDGGRAHSDLCQTSAAISMVPGHKRPLGTTVMNNSCGAQMDSIDGGRDHSDLPQTKGHMAGPHIEVYKIMIDSK